MTTNVDLEKLQKDAVDIFNQGFACSESVIYAIKENFELDMSDDAIAMSSGFPWGLGGGGCICGALAGQRCVSDISSDVRHLVILRLTAVSSFRTKSTISSRNTVVQHAAVF